MCYSAQIRKDFARFTREFGAVIDITEFVRLYWERSEGSKAKIPKALDAAFAEPATADERRIKELIDAWDKEQAGRLEQEVFKQRKRLADAQRTLQVKTTKAATESRRIATAKVEWALGKLADLRRTTLVDEDARVFPGWFAPVIVGEGGRRVIRPMRYQCRLPGKPAFHDTRFPGTYNARRDSLGGYWKEAFGASHAILVVNAFFENVSRHAMEHRDLAPREKEENVVLEFRPQPAQDMLVACLWSRWTGAGEPDLLSFAAITDEPPAEIAAAGHDRCIIPVAAENMDAWLAGGDAPSMQAILDDRSRPTYEFRLAA